VVILHLLFLLIFKDAIIVNKRNDRLKNLVFIVTGIGLLLLGLVVMDGAFAFIEIQIIDTPPPPRIATHIYPF